MRPIPDMAPPDFERFLRMVKKNEASGCWLWQGALNGAGYGIFTIRDKQYAAHRVSAVWLAGLNLANLYACHKCDNPPCVNPEHLFAGTAKDNTLDMVAKGRGVGFNAMAVKLERRDLHQVQTMLSEGRSHAEVADFLGISVGDLHRSLRVDYGNLGPRERGWSNAEEFAFVHEQLDRYLGLDD